PRCGAVVPINNAAPARNNDTERNLAPAPAVRAGREEKTPELNVDPRKQAANGGDPPTLLAKKPPSSQGIQRINLPVYEILRELGRGGMGVVYKARQRGLNRIVAIKMILAAAHAGPKELARFSHEAEVVAQLHHPHIVQIYEVGNADGRPFFSLEFVPGGSLASQLDGTPWPVRQAVQQVVKLAGAIQAAHQLGIIHRDLKPANVLMDVDGTPKITDFGLAKRTDDAAGPTQSGAILGTPSYMSPEQAEGKTHNIGPVADVYA